MEASGVSPSQRRYSPEFKQRAVRMVRQLRAETGEKHGTLQRVATQLGCGVESLRLWVHQDLIDHGEQPGTSTEEGERLKELEQEVRELMRSGRRLRECSLLSGANIHCCTLFLLIPFLVVACSGSGQRAGPVPSLPTSTAINTTSTVATTVPSTTIPPLTTTTTIPSVRYTFAEGVPGDQQDSVRQGMDAAATYISNRIAPLRQPVTVDVRTDEANKCLPSLNVIASALGHTITVCAATAFWMGTTDVYRQKIVAHEYFHIVQGDLGASGTAPSWLVEGAAEFVGWATVIDNGAITLEGARAILGLTRGVSRLAPVAPLESLETPSAVSDAQRTGPAYNLLYAAADVLVSRSGIESFRTFFSGLHGGDWRPVFATAFGQSVDSFYAEFAQLRLG